MAEALANGHDSVITIGGIQSNHCRATAAAATYLGMDCHLILRNTEHHARQDAGLVGNLLPERLQGAHIHQVRLHSHSNPTLPPRKQRIIHAADRSYSTVCGECSCVWGGFAAVAPAAWSRVPVHCPQATAVPAQRSMTQRRRRAAV